MTDCTIGQASGDDFPLPSCKMASEPSPSGRGLTETQLLSFYYNAVLEDIDDFVDVFIKNSLEISANDEFYAVLAQYCESCRRKEQLDSEISTLLSQWEILRPTLWEHENRVITQRGKCGDGVVASGSQPVPRSTFNQKSSDKLKSLTNSINDVRFDKLSTVLLEMNFARLQCQSQIQKSVHQFLAVNNLTPNHPAYVSYDRKCNSPQESAKGWIWHCISVLFHYLREPSLPRAFSIDAKSWLCNLIGTLTRNAFPEDHLVILCHLLRCPQGMASWAKNFVQPLSPIELFDSTPSVNHFLAMLNLLFSPIRKREQYLKSYMQTELDNNWTIVDTDGDDESHLISIPESDLLALLSQFSFDRSLYQFFSSLVQSDMTEHRILTLFAFELTVLKVLFEGLRTYNCAQYRQICKHIGLMIRKSVQYVSEFWQTSRTFVTMSSVDLQFEFDRLFFRAVYCIVSSRSLGVWQFLVDLPFDVVSSDFVLRIVYMLMNVENVSPSDVFSISPDDMSAVVRDIKRLDQRLIDLDEMDAIYLLTALSNIASTSNDDNLIVPIVVQIFNACFVNDSTRGLFHKSGRQLLTNIADHHSDIVPLCVDLIDENLSVVGGYALELMAALPLNQFRVDTKRWMMVRRWLESPLQSLSSALAQQMLKSLNWKFETDEGFLFLDYNLHKDVAIAVAKTHGVRCQIQSSMIGCSVKKVGKLASTVSGTINFEQQFDTFCWDLLLKLKLNPSDFNATVAQSIAGTDFQIDKFDLTSFYVAFQLNCIRVDRVSDLLSCIEKLLDNYLFKAAITCISTVVPLLAGDGNLINDQRWLQCIFRAVRCDESYLQYAKQLITGNFPGENLQLIGSMLSYSMNRCLGSNFENAEKFCRYWLLLLCHSDLKSWNTNQSTLFLIDSIIRQSIFFDPTFASIEKVFVSIYEQMLSSVGKQTKGFFSKLFGDEPPPEFFPASNFSNAPWLAFVAIKVEENCYSDLFESLNLELLSHPSQNLEQALRKVCGKRGLAFPLQRLPVFQWLNLCLSMSPDHVLLPLALQQFCVHHLRLVKVRDPSLPGAVFASRFETVAPEKFSNLSSVLTLAIESVKQTSTVLHGDRNLFELFSAIKAWLNDKRLHTTLRNVSNIDVPMKYLLDTVVRGDRVFWSDFIDFDRLRVEITKDLFYWIELRHLNVSKLAPTPVQRSPTTTNHGENINRLMEKIKTACQPIDDVPPVFLSPSDLFPYPDVNILCDLPKLIKITDPHLHILTNAAKSFVETKSTVQSLNKEFFTLIKKLYSEIDSQITIVLKCNNNCVNPNKMKMNVKCSKFNDYVNRQLIENGNAWNGNAQKIVSLMSTDVPANAVSIISVVKGISSTFVQSKPETDVWNCLKTNAIQLFFRYVSQLDSRALNFSATRITYVQCIEILGQNFISGNPEQVESMFNVLVTNEDLCGLLLPYFTPESTDFSICHRLYAQLTETSVDKQLWRSILLKFEISSILSKCAIIEIMEFFKSSLIGCRNSFKLGFHDVFEIYRRNFSTIVFYNFPQSFTSFIDLLLNDSAAKLALPVLFADIVDKFGTLEFTSEYTLLPYIAFDLVPILERVFENYKKSCAFCATNGLFHCWKSCASSVSSFQRLIFMSTVQTTNVPTSIVDCEENLKKSFDLLCSLFGPWIEPYVGVTKTSAPWIADDAQLISSTVFDAFVACLLRLQQIYEKVLPPNSNNIYELVWTYYSEKLCNINVADNFIYDVNITHLLKLSWNNFWPNLIVMNSLRKSFVDFPAASHGLTTGIVVRIPWVVVAQSYDSNQPLAAKSAFYDILLEILIRCASRKENYANCKASLPHTFNNLCGVHWEFVAVARLNEILNFIVSTLGADLIFAADDDIRRCVLKLLEHVTQFLPLAPCVDEEHRLDRIEKRRAFLRMLVECLTKCSESKTSSPDLAARYIDNLLDRIELLIHMNVNENDKNEEAKVLLHEFISVWNNVGRGQFFDATQVALFSWLDSHSDANILVPLFAACGRCLTNFANVLTFQEKCLSAYFTRVIPPPRWIEISSALVLNDNFAPNYVQECRNQSKLLSLYAFFMQKLPRSSDLSDETVVIRDILCILDVLKEKQIAEPLIVLYCGLAIELLSRQPQYGARIESVMILFNNFLDDLQNAVADKNGGLLSAIGLSKKASYPPRFKLFSQLIISFMQQQILAEREIRLSPDAAVTNSKIQYVKSLKNQKQYASYVGSIDLASEYLSDTSKTFADAYELFSKLVLTMYNEKFIIDKLQL